MKKMKKQFEIAAVMVAIMVLSVLMVHPVMSGLGDENTTNVTKTNEDSMAKYFYLDTEGTKISTTITNKTNVPEREFLISMAVTGNLVGTILFYSDRDGDNEIYVMNPDGTNVTKLTINTASDTNPAWFPDCKKIAFSSDRDGDSEIYVMDTDGTNVVRLTSNTALDQQPDISSDGSKIAFVSKRDGDLNIYVMNTDGTNVTKLTINTASDSAPAWSPDGSKIAFCSDRGGNWKIYVMNADGGTNVVRLTRNIDYSDMQPAWSPDGSKIAFVSNRDGYFEIYVMDSDGTNVVQLTRTADPVNQLPAWSPDGKRIAFTSSRDGDNEVYVMDADGTNVTQLTKNTADDTNSNWRAPRVWDSGIYDTNGTISETLPASGAPTSGRWIGTTSKGKAVAFNVTNTQVNNFSISYSYSCSGGYGQGTFKRSLIDIVENKFQYDSSDTRIYGEFTSPNFATGTYRRTWTTYFPFMDTCNSGKISWSARRVQTTGDININEIMYNPPGADTDNEWLELYNNDTTDIDITGWRFYEAGTNHSLTLIQGGMIIPAGGYAIIADNATTFLDEYQECNCTVIDSAFSLNNSGEYIALKNATLDIIDEVAYNASWGADGNGRTLELNATGGWEGSRVDGGTPCQQNSVLA
ncbi:MAG: PD40 domain-containing protein, partial [Methanophagales archaeon]|nr:PD40 domain-containing protein [Methanophagales archaeon]